ncbi:RsmB/NOP family class I SAM-dependent RNA methyltransferase [Sphingomonas flavalba]|uniref:RsmB/NOP family class I SAM-dependent RNA methyltransferase n=1 Tax=Sphingomonas flavalba TaxID=2559804 RepID=UPI0039E08E7F
MTQPVPDGAGVPARRAALRLLDAVLRQGRALDHALPAATKGIARADDRALAHAIAAEALRRLPDLDALIDSATRKRLPDDAKARFALRIALVQALALHTPGHAAIATVLPLVDGGPRKLVHGVFGTLMRRGAVLPAPPSLPRNVALRWAEAWGRAMVDGAGAAIAAPPPLDLTVKPGAIAPEGAVLAPGHVRVAAADVTALPGFAEGGWWVQDLAASLPARLLGPGDGRQVIDLCAAPGGKTMQLCATGWQVTALEQVPARLERLRDNLERTQLSAELVAADVMQWAPAAPADAVLLDAPCSATGIFRRHPDVLHRVRAKDIAALAEVQAAMLARAADWVRPGGTLVYATCSLEPAEGEAQISAFLAARGDYRPAPVAATELPAGIIPADGFVRTLPGMLADAGGLDGFFVARMIRQD